MEQLRQSTENRRFFTFTGGITGSLNETGGTKLDLIKAAIIAGCRGAVFTTFDAIEEGKKLISDLSPNLVVLAVADPANDIQDFKRNDKYANQALGAYRKGGNAFVIRDTPERMAEHMRPPLLPSQMKGADKP